jgi:phosphopentomutase
MLRAIIIVIDGLGIGEMPDAGDYNDEGSNTLAHIAEAAGGLSLPCLESMGLGNIGDFKGIEKNTNPIASYGIMSERSKGKDTITGHWEMMGIVSERPFPTYPDGFPREIIKAFEKKTGRRVIGNKAASGTEIIKELGEEHIGTGSLIVYTSADSVFQIAAHGDVMSAEELYKVCRIAREILVYPHNVCRVIARPFVGEGGPRTPFIRTPLRRDFSLPPPETTVLDLLKEKGINVISVGKVSDMFSGRGFTDAIKTIDNSDSMKKVKELLKGIRGGLIFTNLVDFDTLYGHRNDPQGFADALEKFDSELADMIDALDENDYLIAAADHGNDPTTPSTDHSREYVPVLFYNKNLHTKDLGMRDCFRDVGATVGKIFGVESVKGRSFY